MPPDPHASGDVGLLLGIVWVAFALWLRRIAEKKVSPAEEAAFGVAKHVLLASISLVIFAVYGLGALGCVFLLTLALDAFADLHLRELVASELSQLGPLRSTLAILVVGSLVFVVLRLFDRWTGRKHTICPPA